MTNKSMQEQVLWEKALTSANGSTWRHRISFATLRAVLRRPLQTALLFAQPRLYETVLRETVNKDLDILRKNYGVLAQMTGITLINSRTVSKVIHEISPSIQEFSSHALNPFHAFLYLVVRRLHPETVVETGVLYGASSAALLQGLEDNKFGKLVSIDLPPYKHRVVINSRNCIQNALLSPKHSVGSAVPHRLRHRWRLMLGNSLDLLPQLLPELGPISLFVHDSLHTFGHMSAEYQLGYEALDKGGVLVSDDVQYNSAWEKFCLEKGENSSVVAKAVDTGSRFGFLIKS